MRLLALLFLVACAYEPSVAPSDGRPLDGPGGNMDAPAGAPHLVINEIFAETGTDEFVEIHNPASVAVPLDDVYLTDVPDYWALPSGPPTGIVSDFLVRFPAGSEIGAGGIIVVAIDGPTFTARFGGSPTYTIRTPTATATPMRSVVPLAATVGAISDEGEMLVLFEWDGASDRVRDLDIVVHGMPTTGNQLVAKAAVDGPDADTNASAYARDANLTMTMSSRTADGGSDSYQRVMLDEDETVTGGNGISGHDETTEPLDTTWSATSGANPGALSL